MPEELSPLMQQYFDIKRQHPDAILFFHLGDFYETFNEDAHTAHRVLGITLTGRFSGEKRMPMAGVPYRNAASYIRRLLAAGYRVALCDQLQDADQAKGGLVERGVVRIVSPGTLLEEVELADRRAHYLAALVEDNARLGLACVDLSTGAFEADDLEPATLTDEIARLRPAEILTPASQRERFAALAEQGIMLTPYGDWAFERDGAVRDLREHFQVADLAGFGVGELGPGLAAAGALLNYLRETQRGPLAHIRRLAPRLTSRRMRLDANTLRALELFETSRDREVQGSLLGVLDHCETAMGSRLLREWLCAPLLDPAEIRARLEQVQALYDDPARAREIAARLRAVGDLQRLAGRLGSGRATPRDLGGLRDSLAPLPELAARAAHLVDGISPHVELRAHLEAALIETPPNVSNEGGIFRRGFDQELDNLLALKSDARGVLDRLARRESERTGIPSLKVGYNSVFGYYIEVTHAQTDKVPPDYVRKQTLKNAERYITAELKDLETQILNAEDSARRRERALFEALRAEAARHIPALQETAAALAKLDALQSLARAARENGYVRPEIDDSTDLVIEGGRHPVVERLTGTKFVPNDTRMDASRRVLLITGPNMAGKSTYIRQAALITIMAQAGSFVPAARARVGVADRVFARIGASDELQRGVSTFMQEMLETANLLHHATERSLVVLDELGRGTSTFDGVSIAWAVCERLHNDARARTLFATHYHELAGLAQTLPRVANLHTAVREWKGGIVFLYRIAEGAASRSYGIHVARLAGIPKEITDRAALILEQLEQATAGATPHSTLQLGLFQLVPRERAPDANPILDELRRLNLDSLTPLEALRKLAEWQRLERQQH